ncbi:hypothetical protein C443_20107 [Haloarcula argentinensis DSM 12282]|nr:hypothetical protein C443_20107 [Haloarcula argentinensis DSM 12282]
MHGHLLRTIKNVFTSSDISVALDAGRHASAISLVPPKIDTDSDDWIFEIFGPKKTTSSAGASIYSVFGIVSQYSGCYGY